MYSAEALSLLQKTDLAVSTLEPLIRQTSRGGLSQAAGSRGVLARYSWGGGVDRADLDEAGPKLDASLLFLNRWFPIRQFPISFFFPFVSSQFHSSFLAGAPDRVKTEFNYNRAIVRTNSACLALVHLRIAQLQPCTPNQMVRQCARRRHEMHVSYLPRLGRAWLNHTLDQKP
jgi:hypothetical protein